MLRLLALAVLAAGGCATSRPAEPTTSVPADASPGPSALAPLDSAAVRIALGETVAVGGVPVRFTRVVEDSRCPPDVSCVWAGRARVELVAAGETFVLSVPGYGPDDQPSEATAGGLTVQVSALAGPAPSQGGPAPPVWVEITAARAAGR